MSDNKAKTGQKGPRGLRRERQHFCPKHDALCSPAMMMPGKRMIWTCPKGCSLPKTGTILK